MAGTFRGRPRMTTTTSVRKSGKRRAPRGKKKEPTVSRLRAPEDMSLPQWQVALRRQFGREQSFETQNLGDDPLFSQFRVRNPQTGGDYRVDIRGSALGANRCTCADFATNELGTCKHIEFLLAQLERKRGAKSTLLRGFEPDHSEVWLQYGAERAVRLRLGAKTPAALRKQAQSLFEAADGWRLPPTRFDRLDAFARRAQELGHELRIDDDVRDYIDQAEAAGVRRRTLRQCYPQGADDPALTGLLRVPMFRYQAEGALFAATAGRALIADEMGLGKTVQAIAATELWCRHFGAQRVLIVCPTSLKHQWAQELKRFAGRGALIVEGNALERARHYAAPADCKVVSYDALVRDLDLANAWKPDVLIVDEAQRIKNWDTKAARALKRLDSRHAVILTGTPLENRLEELLSVVQLVDRHRLGPTWRFLHEHQLCDDSGRVTGYRNLDQIGDTLAPILLRRRKVEVLDQLPERRDLNLFVPLTDLQRQLHDEYADIVARIVARWRRFRHLSDADKKRLQAALLRMRMVCDSSHLLDPDTESGHKIPELMDWLDQRLDEADAKVVIFSAWLGSHGLIARELKARGIGHVLFNGAVPTRKRGALVDRFRTDPNCRVFLATDAGGVGLNLQHAASLIVNLDLPWNPAVLEQRIGRVYRLGQERRVEVVNFIAENSIEHNMLGILRFKRSLFQGVLEGGDGEVHLEGTRLSRFMDSVNAVTGAAAEALAASDAQDVDTGRNEDPESAVAADQPVAPAAVAAQADSAGPPVQHLGDPASAVTQGGTDPAHHVQPTTRATAGPSTTVPIDSFAPLLGLAGEFLSHLAKAAANPETSPLIERDPETGRSSLRLPLPEPELLRRLTQVVQALLPNDSGGT